MALPHDAATIVGRMGGDAGQGRLRSRVYARDLERDRPKGCRPDISPAPIADSRRTKAEDQKGPSAELRLLDGLRSHQQFAGLLNSHARIFFKLRVRSAADRVANDGEPVAWHAENTAHELSRVSEALRHDAQSGHPLPLCRYRVVQTAR
jgi:hypothetical protein